LNEGCHNYDETIYDRHPPHDNPLHNFKHDDPNIYRKKRICRRPNSNPSNLSVTCRRHDGLGVSGTASRSNVLAREVHQECGVLVTERTRASECIEDTIAPKIGIAVLVGGGVGAGEGLALDLGDDGRDVLEDVALGQHHAARVDLEGVAAAVRLVEVVVHGVEQRVAADLGRAAREVVDVVVLQGDQVRRAKEEEVPVVIGVAVGRP
jgi:hypothetical protein